MDELQSGPLMVKSLTGRHFEERSVEETLCSPMEDLGEYLKDEITHASISPPHEFEGYSSSWMGLCT